MRNSTPSIGIAQVITARRWQKPSWQRQGPPEGNLADMFFLLHVHARIHVVKAQRVAASLSLECVEFDR